LIFDTTALIQAIRNKEKFEEGSISIITLVEVLRGIEDEERREKMIGLLEETFEILDINLEVAQSYVELYFELKKKGKTISDADGLIAATAKSKNDTLLTLDKGFKKFEPYVKVEMMSSGYGSAL
jgi:tRNA(fMet)-specific endonuclease VapC